MRGLISVLSKAAPELTRTRMKTTCAIVIRMGWDLYAALEAPDAKCAASASWAAMAATAERKQLPIKTSNHILFITMIS